MTLQKINKVTARMYSMGTGDFFVFKFHHNSTRKFTMMVDCGSCTGGSAEFEPYIKNMKEYVGETGIDLLLVTHEHQDHVNGFHKCRDIFEEIKIKEAWFGWTENLNDKTGKVKELLEKKGKMRQAFANGKEYYRQNQKKAEENLKENFNFHKIQAANEAFMAGLDTLADINLPARDEPAEYNSSKASAIRNADSTATEDSANYESLAGMKALREKLARDHIKTEYLCPGEIRQLEAAPGLKFYVLGPPKEFELMFKEGKQGKDIYKKYFDLNQYMFAAKAFSSLTNEKMHADSPFDSKYAYDYNPGNGQTGVIPSADETAIQKMISKYETESPWRKIDTDFLSALGSLGIRLNSHLNNTSLVIAIESEQSQNVILLPGDAEYGSWGSWHLIPDWLPKKENEKPLAEDLLNRTIFYKAGHHLSYNGTALEKGIKMMPKHGMAAMASLDRERISSKWKNTMPNKPLLEDLIKRCDGRVFLMNEHDIPDPPSETVELQLLSNFDQSNPLYKQYSFDF